ncbi:MAG: TonB-dependent receptor [Gammaproteobacteria bacterium]|nr:TonB-dependent receptor [Gammaproteobacteria bacterium]
MRIDPRRITVFASLATFAVILGSPASGEDSAGTAASKPEELEVVVVTGSLIQRPNNTSVSPITTVSAESIKETGASNLQDALNQLPAFTVGGNATTGGQGTGGRASINLHGLGTNRNLVLLDGKRLPVSDIFGNVDVNILPEAIISGVDAITGGASAVYGSDAMSGVVNFKTIRGFNGVKVDVQDSRSAKGDAGKVDASIAFGSAFMENRGHMVTAFSYSKQDPLLSSARRFFADKVPSSYIGYGTYLLDSANAPNAAVLTSLFNSYGITAPLNTGGGLGFNNDGTLFTQNGAANYKGANGSNGYAVIGGNVRMPVGQQGNILNAINRKTAFWKADYDLAPTVSVYGQFMYVNLSVNSNSGGSLTQFPALTTIPTSNPFIPADLRTVLASRPNAGAPFAWRARYVGIPWKNWDENYVVQQYLGGIKGDIAPGWGFDVYASYDSSVHNSIMHDAVLKSRVQTLLNAPNGGASICAGGYNPFGDANARSLSAACIAYMTKDANSQENLSQDQVQAQINGKLFDLGAGPAQVAFVADYRRNTYSFAPDADTTANSGWGPGGNIEAFTVQSAVPERSIKVKELAAQLDVPLMANRIHVRELAVGAAARVSDYSGSGTVQSFEFDGRWRPVDQLLFRGSYQRAVRAPNIGELYSPLGANSQLVIGTPPGAIGDPCDDRSTARTGANSAQVQALCVAQGVPSGVIANYEFPTTATGQTNAGNPTLTPEKANTFNLGLVFGLNPDFTLSLDYYNISIKNVISTTPGLTVLSKCFNLDGSNPTYSNSNLYCQAIYRDPNTGTLLTVATPYANLGGLKTDGLELQLHWARHAPFGNRAGKFYVDPAISYLNSYKVQLLPGAPEFNYTGISVGGTGPGSVPPRAAPKLKALTSFGFRTGAYTAGLRWRYQSSLKDVSSILTPNNAQIGVPAYQLWDLFGTVNVGASVQLRAGINNLFDKGLPVVASSQNGTDQALYDAIGRAYYLGLKASF